MAADPATLITTGTAGTAAKRTASSAVSASAASVGAGCCVFPGDGYRVWPFASAARTAFAIFCFQITGYISASSGSAVFGGCPCGYTGIAPEGYHVFIDRDRDFRPFGKLALTGYGKIAVALATATPTAAAASMGITSAATPAVTRLVRAPV